MPGQRSSEGEPADSTLGPGYIRDFISGRPVRAGPEEVEAVQVFSRRLVDDYGYPRDYIRTRPQFQIRKRPSDTRGSWPVDIAVFRSPEQLEPDLFMVVECKKPQRKDGIDQLHRYMDRSAAAIGVWFNGRDHAYVRKILHQDGTATYHDLPSIPRFGQRLEDIGQYARRDLKPPSNLKSVFNDLRHYLAGNATGITRDEQLAQEIINILFCKIYDEINTAQDDMVTFRSGVDEPPSDVHSRVANLFARVKSEYADVLDPADEIRLDTESISYVVGELQNYCLTEADRDAIGEAFEVFIGPTLRGSEGQFFTPRNVVKMMVKMLDPKPGESIVDPACGSGGFLISALAHVWSSVDQEGLDKGWTDVLTDRRKREISTRYFRGIDKDGFLAKVTKAYMAIVGDGRGGVFCENSLYDPDEWSSGARDAIKLGTFDVVLTNPPFGQKIRIEGAGVLSQYSLAYKWKTDKQTGRLAKTGQLNDFRPPQILFVERCLQMLKPGGRMGIVLPESIFGMPTHQYVVQYLMEEVRIRGIVAMPEPLFKTSGKGGTHAKVCVVFVENTPPSPRDDHEIFMADAQWCGHDSRGNRTIRRSADGTEELLDDVPLIAERFLEMYGSADSFWARGG